MEHTVSGLTHFVNLYLGHAANWVLASMGLHPENASQPIPEHVAMGLFVLIVATLLALVLRLRLSVEKPGALQQIAEGLLTNSMEFGIRDLLEENVGRQARGLCRFHRAVYFARKFVRRIPVPHRAYWRRYRAARLRRAHVHLFQRGRRPAPWTARLPKNLRRLAARPRRLDLGDSSFSRGNHQHVRARPLPHRPFVGQYVRE